MMADMRRLSEAVYVGLCHKIGRCEEISMRRDIIDIADVIKEITGGIGSMLSGSFREGFRLLESDQDIMAWELNHKVLCDLSQAQHYRKPGTFLYLMECIESRPGFVLLQRLTPLRNIAVGFLFVRVNGLTYISSSLYRKWVLRCCGNRFNEHGPCANIVQDDLEFDEAYCFSCDFWPPPAASWVRRCHRWPPTPVLYEIIVSGCHVMAIGSKGSSDEYIEWRLSFSQAEQKLVYAMNHSQFLVYGLLKLFLKEVINQVNQEKLLCSYFMKTAVFWEIQENSISSWCSQNVLHCFWACYKRVMKWVYNGYCPNFFVTENNMFLGKVWGCAQNTLFLQLNTLYEKGMSCLLYCQSVRLYLYELLCKPLNIPDLDSSSITSEKFAMEISKEIVIHRKGCRANGMNILAKCLRCFKYLEHLSKTKPTKYQALFLHLTAIEWLIYFAFNIQQIHFGGNRLMYKANKFSCKVLKNVARSGFVSDMLYLAMYYYSTGSYTKALTVLTMTESQFTQHNLTFNENGNIEKCIVKTGGNPLLRLQKMFMFLHLPLVNSAVYIKHLALELEVSEANERYSLDVHPLVLLRMLYVLCYSNINKDLAQEALHDLYMLVHHYNMFIPPTLKDTSYQILGICQEICGAFPAAIDSYKMSLSCEQFNRIGEASLIRIQHILSKTVNTHLRSNMV